MTKRRILVLAPHTDDGEFGCGGTICRLVAEGDLITYVAFSAAENSLPEAWPPDTLREEVKDATKVLGIHTQDVRLFDYPTRDFPQFRQQILEEMILMKKEIKPDLVLLPSTNDTHQDHQIVSQEGFRAFKTTSMLGYELPWNNLTFRTNFFVCLEDHHINKKIEALHCYRSQQERPYASAEFVKSLAVTRGTQIGVKYAEVFESIRWVLKADTRIDLPC
jgi:LmbE family N-acetylglucosaminyl deacetylase